MRFTIPAIAAVALCVGAAGLSTPRAQQADKSSVAAPAVKAASRKKPVPRRPIVEAKALFGAAGTSAALASRAIGSYARGCLAGAEPLAIDGPNWQAMRLSRNRNWGHPQLVRLIERLAADAKAQDGWSGLLVGDISQPRGGPMLTGHASHQVGLDADVWLTPMPSQRLSDKEREELSATSMLGQDGILVDPKVWTESHAKLIVRAASYPEVDRVFVHPGIKKALCEQPGLDRKNLRKVQPYWGHHFHMHIRMACPAGSEGCTGQVARPAEDGCGQEIEQWLTLLRRPPPRPAPSPDVAKAKKPRLGITMAQLPAECRVVINAGAGKKPNATP